MVIASHCRLAELSVLPHGICDHCEIVKAVGANEAQVVMHGLQAIYHCSFILAFFPASWAEGQTALPLQGLRQVDALQAHYLWQLIGCYDPEEVDVL